MFRKVDSNFFSVINCSFAARITTETTTCAWLWGSGAMQQMKTKKIMPVIKTSLHSESNQFALCKDLEGYHSLWSSSFVSSKQAGKGKGLGRNVEKN